MAIPVLRWLSVGCSSMVSVSFVVVGLIHATAGYAENIDRVGAVAIPADPAPSRGVTDVEVAGSIVYIAQDTLGFTIVDVSDPAAPVVVGTIVIGAISLPVKGLHVDGSRLYVGIGTRWEDSTEIGGKFYIYDISSPATPGFLGSYDVDGYIPGDIYVRGDTAYIANRDTAIQWGGLVILDVSNPAGIQLIGQYRTLDVFPNSNVWAWDVAVYGQYAYISTEAFGGTPLGSQILVINMATPTAPVRTGMIDFPGATGGVALYTDGPWLFARIASGLYDLADPANPVEVPEAVYGRLGHFDLVTQGDYAYAVTPGSAGSPLATYNISNLPSHPHTGEYLLGFPYTNKFTHVAVAGDYIYTSTSADSLMVFWFTGVNRPPVFDPIDTLHVDEGQHLELEIAPYDADSNTIDFGVFNLPPNALYIANTRTIVFDPDFNQAGTYDFLLSVWDAQDTTHMTATVVVHDRERLYSDPVEVISGLVPLSIVSADLDADGDVDLLTTNFGYNAPLDNNLMVQFNNGDATFGLPVTYPLLGELKRPAVIDLNGDTALDLAVPDYAGDSLAVLLNNGDGSFASAVMYYAGTRLWAIWSADFDGDTDNDLAAIVFTDKTVVILMNNGDGTFAAPVPYSVSTFPSAIAGADLDSDGDHDLLVSHRRHPNEDVIILMNNGDGTFTAGTRYPVSQAPWGITLADFDGDSDIDVAAVLNDSVAVMLNDGAGSFGNWSSYFAGKGGADISAMDVDNDGNIDLAGVYYNSGYLNSKMGVLLGNGDGTFQRAVSYPITGRPKGLTLADLDGDSDPDAAVAVAGAEILFNNSVLSGCCINLRGDYNGDGEDATVLDLTFLIDDIYRGRPSAACQDETDLNNDGEYSTILDLTFLIDNIYRGGALPPACP